MHCPISPQCSNWAKDDSRTASELEIDLNEFMTRICQRYNGKQGYISMDVVNETVVGGGWHQNKPGTPWECPWFIIGQDSDENETPLFISMAFEIAKAHAPDLKFIFNHHEGPENESSWNLIKSTIAYLRDKGLRVDGIGWQAHVAEGWDTSENLEKLSDLIDWAHSNNLEFHVTEASVWLYNGNSQSELQAQAVTYSAIVNALLEKRSNGVVAWNTWHISDAHGWYNERFPSLFDDQYQAKPAYYAVQAVLEEHKDEETNVIPSLFRHPFPANGFSRIMLPNSMVPPGNIRQWLINGRKTEALLMKKLAQPVIAAH
jgi:GH35 family endo-1,4-beta-xylanase